MNEKRKILKCHCGVNLRVPADAAGKKFKCPRCGKVSVIKAPPHRAASTATPSIKPAEGQSESPMEAMASVEKQAASFGSSKEASSVCKNCWVKMPPDAVMCIACGFNASTGSQLKSAKASAAQIARVGTLARIFAKTAGSFTLGIILSITGALIGAGIWCGVAIATNFEIGWIAWGLGVLAGYGMYLGYRQQNTQAGLAAAGVSVIGIISAKIMIVAYFISPQITTVLRYAQHDPRVERLALHETALAFRDASLVYGSETRSDILDDQYEKFAGMSDEQLDEAIANLDTWEQGGKWQDERYVRNALIYQYIDDAVGEDDGHEGESEEEDRFSKEQWRSLYVTASKNAKGLSQAEQVDALKRFLHEDELDSKRARLAYHRSDLSAMGQGLSYSDEKRDQLYDEEWEKVNTLDENKLINPITELDAWENGGKWDDGSYVRNYLVYSFIDEALRQQSEDNDAGDDDEEDEISPSQWKSLYDDAVTRVDQIPVDEQPQKAREEEEAARARVEEWVAQLQSSATSEVASYAGTIIGAIITSMFNPFDAIFLLIAVASAYKIAKMGYESS